MPKTQSSPVVHILSAPKMAGLVVGCLFGLRVAGLKVGRLVGRLVGLRVTGPVDGCLEDSAEDPIVNIAVEETVGLTWQELERNHR